MQRVFAQARTEPIKELFQCELQCVWLNAQMLTAGFRAARARFCSATVQYSRATISKGAEAEARTGYG